MFRFSRERDAEDIKNGNAFREIPFERSFLQRKLFASQRQTFKSEIACGTCEWMERKEFGACRSAFQHPRLSRLWPENSTLSLYVNMIIWRRDSLAFGERLWGISHCTFSHFHNSVTGAFQDKEYDSNVTALGTGVCFCAVRCVMAVCMSVCGKRIKLMDT